MINYSKIKFISRNWLEEQASAFDDAVRDLMDYPTTAFKEWVEQKTGLGYDTAWEKEEAWVERLTERFIEYEAKEY